MESVRRLAEDESGIAAAEAEGIGQGRAEHGGTWFADQVEGAGGIRRFHIHTRGKKAPAQSHQANNRLYGSGPAEKMTDATLGAANTDAADGIACPALDSEGFRDVVERGASAVGIDVTNFVRTQTGHGTGGAHAGEGGIALGMGLGEVVQVRAGTAAGDFRQHDRSPGAGLLKAFQNQQPRTFPQSEAVAVGIKGPRHGGTERFQGIKTGKDKLAKGIVSPA